MGITYNAVDDIITVVDFPVGAPCDLEDISVADAAGGWGKVDKLGNNTYRIKCRLDFGDGGT